jgi:Holliday junction resolvasome RuvABC endonuclease subunit
MLQIPWDSGSIISIVGIDPGTTTLGTSVLWVDLSIMKIVASQAMTIRADRLYAESWTGSLFGDRTARVLGLEGELLYLFQGVQPFMIVSESPFISMRQPQAYGALTEAMCAIKSAVMRFDIWKPLYTIDPPRVKQGVGAPGNADKDTVKRHVLALPDLCWSGDVPLAQLDEHSIDALAVAYTQWRNYLKEMNHVVTV